MSSTFASLRRPWSISIIVAVFVLTSAYRMWALTTAPQSPADLSEQRQTVVRWLAASNSLSPGSDGSIDPALFNSELSKLGISSLQWQRFDPQALVVIVPGADGQPGVAGVDDNGDAIIDNRFELGSTGSDDRCEVLTPQQHEALEEITLVLQRGAFMPEAIAFTSESVAKQSDIGAEQRVLVRGQFDGEPWSFIIRLAEPR
jgi:hypothetical protein